MRRAAAGALTTLLLTSCLGFGSESPIPGVAQADPATNACQTAHSSPPTLALLARESAPEDLEGLGYFATDWGQRQGCFRATVVSAPSGIRPSAYDALVVDVGHDATLGPPDMELIRSFLAAGKRVALFAWPLRLADGTVDDGAVGDATALIGGASLKQAHGCGDWQYTAAARGPFLVGGTTYRYENFADTIFTVEAPGPQRSWADVLFCPKHPGSVMIEVPKGFIAGFSIAYTISLADNNVRAVAMKGMVVDVFKALAAPSPAFS